MDEMRWIQLLSATRLGSKKSLTEQARSPFHKDYDRIIFSPSFRQLNRKTQVHPLTQHDGIHTRLTHSLEVSCIGRSLGMLAAEKISRHLPDWINPSDVGAIIQAACLAHDIGNPPFGHAGEYAIRDWFDQAANQGALDDLTAVQQADVRQFEGNAQGLRILTRLDYHPDDGGMRLTFATLGAYLKYPWLPKPIAQQAKLQVNQREKFGCYQTEKYILKQIADTLGLIEHSEFNYCRHPLTYLLEAADDICYALIDLEDGIALNMLEYDEVEPIFLNLIADYGKPEELMNDTTWQQRIAALRGRVMKRLVDQVSSTFAKYHNQILAGQLNGHLLDYCDEDIGVGIEAAKQLARQKIFQHQQKSRLELLAHHSIQHLLDAFMPLTFTQQNLNFKQDRLQQILRQKNIILGHDRYQNIMLILDMISKLSDHEAYELSQLLQGRSRELY